AESDPPSITSTPAIESRSDSREKPSPAKSGSDWPSRSGIIAVLPKRIVSGDLMGRYMRLPSGENLGMQKPAQLDFGGPPATGTAKVAMGPSCTPASEQDDQPLSVPGNPEQRADRIRRNPGAMGAVPVHARDVVGSSFGQAKENLTARSKERRRVAQGGDSSGRRRAIETCQPDFRLTSGGLRREHDLLAVLRDVVISYREAGDDGLALGRIEVIAPELGRGSG